MSRSAKQTKQTQIKITTSRRSSRTIVICFGITWRLSKSERTTTTKYFRKQDEYSSIFMRKTSTSYRLAQARNRTGTNFHFTCFMIN